MILANRRSAARCAIVVHSAELPECATKMEPHIVLERDMSVRVVRALERKSVGRPVLPPVLVQLESVVEPTLLSIEESGPRAPRRLIRSTQKSEIIDFESRR